jgi:hypothetical protein
MLGFRRTQHSLSEHPQGDILYTTVDFLLLPSLAHPRKLLRRPDYQRCRPSAPRSAPEIVADKKFNCTQRNLLNRPPSRALPDCDVEDLHYKATRGFHASILFTPGSSRVTPIRKQSTWVGKVQFLGKPPAAGLPDLSSWHRQELCRQYRRPNVWYLGRPADHHAGQHHARRQRYAPVGVRLRRSQISRLCRWIHRQFLASGTKAGCAAGIEARNPLTVLYRHLPRRLSSVHHQHMAGNVIRRIGGEKHSRPFQIMVTSESAQRNSVQQEFSVFFQSRPQTYPWGTSPARWRSPECCVQPTCRPDLWSR